MHAPPVAALGPAVRRAILGLGLTQILGWGSTYYLLSLLGSTFGRDLGLSNGLMLAGISITLASAAILGPRIGRWQDRAGSRIVMTTGSVIMATGLCILSLAHSWIVYYAGWIVIGIGSPMALYSASFCSSNNPMRIGPIPSSGSFSSTPSIIIITRRSSGAATGNLQPLPKRP